MIALSTPLQLLGGPEVVVLGLILLPLVVLAVIGYVLVQRLLSLPDPNRVAELEREVEALRQRVEQLDDEP
jgi:cell division protein FtsB